MNDSVLIVSEECNNIIIFCVMSVEVLTVNTKVALDANCG